MEAVRWDSKADDAIEAFQRAVAADPDSPLTYAGLAEAQWFKFFATQNQVWLARTTEAERQVELRNPDLAAVHRILGLLVYNSGRYEQAVAEYQRAIELEPSNSDSYRRLGRTFEKNNESDKALAAYGRAVEIEPGYYRNQQGLGAFWYGRANYEKAVNYFAKAAELAPNEATVRLVLGQAYLNSGEFTQAEAQFRSALSLKETENALFLLGLSLLYQSRERDAVPQLRRALSLGPESYVWLTSLGTAYRRVHLDAESRLANRRGLRLAEEELARNPNDQRARRFSAYLSARMGDSGRALSEISQALSLSPNDSDTLWMAALTYEALGLHDKTIELLKNAPRGVVADLSRWPDVADLNKNPRFIQLLGSR
jgi:tetratricopeptide (TPR) repeat protein